MSERPKGVPTKQIENERVIVTQWRFAPGAETGWHRHGHDYVVVPLLDGKLAIDDGKQTHVAEMRAGGSYNRPIGVEHNVINANDFEYAFVQIELKSAGQATASRQGATSRARTKGARQESGALPDQGAGPRL